MASFANTTLAELVSDIDTINERILCGGVVIDIAELDERTEHLHRMIRYLQGVCRRAADVSNGISKLRKYRAGNYRCATTCVSPSDADTHVLRLTRQPSEPQILAECVPRITVPIVPVSCRSQIPNHPLYYIENEKQFAVNIAGCIVAGCIGDQEKRGGLRTGICQYGAQCEAIATGKSCDYWHDPHDFIAAGRQVPLEHWRNFTPGSFVYSGSNMPISVADYSTRHVGCRSALVRDMHRLARSNYAEEITTRASQLAHDILIYVLLNKAGFYSHDPRISDLQFLSQV